MDANESATTPPRSVPPLRRTAVVYGLMLVAAVGIFFWIRAHGETLTAGAPPPEAVAGAGSGAPSAASDALFHVLVALAAVILVGRLLARLFAFIHQPPVIGEVVAGILLGPSLLGETASAWILPASVAPFLGVIAQVGIILYMFLVGLELDGSALRERAHAAVATSHASIVAPFLLGAALAVGLYPRLATSDVPFTSFALFLGTAMSITAFPVLARILADRGMSRTELGVVALSCAATDDVTAWCLLAIVVGVAQAQVSQGLYVTVGALAFILAVFFLVRPLVRRVVRRWPEEGSLPQGAVAGVFVAVLLSALATESIGIHAVFGAFLLGAIIPHDSAVARHFTHRLGEVVTILLLPAFFAFTGMRTRIDLVTGLDNWLICGLIILVATAGKLGGTLVAARFTGLSWRDAAALGTLMNTRGLMELIVLNIGLDLGVISPTLFAMMVVMALVTTMATAPVLRVLVPEAGRNRAPTAATARPSP